MVVVAERNISTATGAAENNKFGGGKKKLLRVTAKGNSFF